MKINGILLAAGFSSRFSGNKLKAKIDGKPMLVHAMEKMIDQSFHHFFLIIRKESRLDEIQNFPIQVIENHQSEKGISSSIRLGIEAEEADGYFFLVCDQPFLKRESISKMIEAFKKGEKGMVCLRAGEQYGNPAVFSNKYRQEFFNLTGDTGGKQILNRHLEDVLLIEAEKKELLDLDTMEQYQKWTGE